MNIQNPSEKPEVSEAVKKFLKLRGILREILPDDFVYIPRGALQFLKVGTPEELRDIGGGTYSPLPLSESDEREALALAKKCGTTIPEKYLRNRKPTFCSCGHIH